MSDGLFLYRSIGLNSAPGQRMMRLDPATVTAKFSIPRPCAEFGGPNLSSRSRVRGLGRLIFLGACRMSIAEIYGPRLPGIADIYGHLPPLYTSENIIDFYKRLVERKPRRPRKPTILSVKKQADAAGIEVARFEVKPDGTIAAVTGKPETPTNDNDLDKWLAKHPCE